MRSPFSATQTKGLPQYNRVPVYEEEYHFTNFFDFTAHALRQSLRKGIEHFFFCFFITAKYKINKKIMKSNESLCINVFLELYKT